MKVTLILASIAFLPFTQALTPLEVKTQLLVTNKYDKLIRPGFGGGPDDIKIQIKVRGIIFD
jgi:hypothetical protein